jgi:hypothetical protein
MKIGVSVEDRKPIELDLPRILDGRLLLQANSGGGKSYCVRKLCEITHGKTQQIIIDPEGEFATLREKYDYVLVGKDGDIPINVRASDLLARRLLELGTSAIIDLYELKHNERKRFVKLFLEALVNAPKELWHPCIVVIDEAHVFAPETSHGQAESLDAVKDLATRGRKRGYALIAATQRLSKLSKDVVAELNTKLVGRCSLDVDMKRAAYELGFTSKDDIFKLRKLEKGEFYAFGPALTAEVTKIKIGKCVTTHPEAGQTYNDQKIASSNKIKQVLDKLSNLPEEAEEHLKTLEDYKKRVMELTRELKTKVAVINPKDIERSEKRGFDKAQQQFKPIEQQYKLKIRDLESKMSQNVSTINKIQKLTGGDDVLLPPPIVTKTQPPQYTKPSIISRDKLEETIQNQSNGAKKLRQGAMKLLKTVAIFHPTPISKTQLGTQAGFSIKGGTFNTYLSELKREGWLTNNGDMISITNDGLDAAGTVDPIPTDPEQLLIMWCGRFRQGAAKMLKAIFNAKEITKEDLGLEIDMVITAGTFNTYLSELRRNGLVNVNGNNITISESFFP